VKLFLDTANIEEIREINRWGVLGGVTTNPSLVAKENDDPERVWKEILSEVEGPISLETTELEPDAMYRQGLDLAQMAPNAVVKVPMTPDGLNAGKRLIDDGIKINVTRSRRRSSPPRSGRISRRRSSGAWTTSRPTGWTRSWSATSTRSRVRHWCSPRRCVTRCTSSVGARGRRHRDMPFAVFKQLGHRSPTQDWRSSSGLEGPQAGTRERSMSGHHR
jgi:hypothetical protein